MSKVKPVNVIYIDPTTRPGLTLYSALTDLIDAFHPHLNQANIALAWNLNWKTDSDSRLVLGKCKKATDLEKEFHEYDFVILLNFSAWSELSPVQRTALMDHELCHAEVCRNTADELQHDERGRICYRIRKHDLEEFRDIVNRHGMYKSDIEAFVRSCQPLKKHPLLDGIAEKLNVTGEASVEQSRDKILKMERSA